MRLVSTNMDSCTTIAFMKHPMWKRQIKLYDERSYRNYPGIIAFGQKWNGPNTKKMYDTFNRIWTKCEANVKNAKNGRTTNKCVNIYASLNNICIRCKERQKRQSTINFRKIICSDLRFCCNKILKIKLFEAKIERIMNWTLNKIGCGCEKHSY